MVKLMLSLLVGVCMIPSLALSQELQNYTLQEEVDVEKFLCGDITDYVLYETMDSLKTLYKKVKGTAYMDDSLLIVLDTLLTRSNVGKCKLVLSQYYDAIYEYNSNINSYLYVKFTHIIARINIMLGKAGLEFAQFRGVSEYTNQQTQDLVKHLLLAKNLKLILCDQ